jgi:hypothetical protein
LYIYNFRLDDFFIDKEGPTFEIPRRNWHWVSDYDFLYEKLRHLEQRVTVLEENKKPSKESKEGTDESVHSGRD